VTGRGLLRSGGLALRPAEAADLAPLVAVQREAYAKNRTLLGVEPIPLQADYADIMRRMEVWVAEKDSRLVGALILEPRADDLLIWSIAAGPAAQGAGLGRSLLSAAGERARQLGRTVIRLYTGTPLRHLVAWYGRHGFVVERIEALSDRSITHMIKHLDPPLEP
jgi:ribosomal protein S18 acetylase RimI-like enzyme